MTTGFDTVWNIIIRTNISEKTFIPLHKILISWSHLIYVNRKSIPADVQGYDPRGMKKKESVKLYYKMMTLLEGIFTKVKHELKDNVQNNRDTWKCARWAWIEFGLITFEIGFYNQDVASIFSFSFLFFFTIMFT